MNKVYTRSSLSSKDLGRSLYCCFIFFAIIINPVKFLPISADSRFSLEILLLGLAAYPLFVRGKINYFIAHNQPWTFQLYALLICCLAIVTAVIYKIITAL